jgi:uncharacterized membrane protein YdbT with pleckstrin-like domain
MSYVDKSLVAGETVVYRTRLHWIVFLWPVLITAIAIAFLVYGLQHVAEAVGAIAVVLWIARYFVYIASEFAITSKRVIIKVGVMQRRTLELQLTKVEAVSVTQGLLGQLFGCGSILVTGTGGTRESFSNIGSPLEFRKALQSASMS